jgi:methyltransferase (TIGR00027 family)
MARDEVNRKVRIESERRISVSRTEPLIRNISDTALWAAAYRARETDRPDALFRDPLARRLAGTRGEQILEAMPASKSQAWAWITRTYLFDRFIEEQVADGVDMVVNLAAGVDARPYRLDLPSALKWVEVDLPDLVRDKQQALRDETPVCSLEYIGLDVSDEANRRLLFERLGRQSKRVLIVSEGLLLYLAADQVASLAHDLARPESFQRWVFDLVSPGLLKLLKRNLQKPLERADAPLKFGPKEGPLFFTAHGWKPIDVRSMIKTAARLKRLSPWMRLLSLFPESSGEQGSRPWSGICLMERISRELS